jgi:protein-arginine deiminase
MMYTHLDPALRLYVGITDDNQEMRDGIKAAIGAENVLEFDVDLYDGEIWFQDEFEFAYQQTPKGPMDLVLDAVTDWGLDIFPEDELLGPGFGWLERGERPATIHTDSTGNLECTPPLSVSGVEYPFGRIYYGGKPGGKQMVEGLRTFLDAQQVQAPVELDITWLIVGHVDEFFTFVPDSSSAKGFKVLMADHQVTMDILEGLDPRMAIPRYAEWGFSTVQELLDDPVMEMNAQIDQLHMQSLQNKIREEFGLTDDDIIPVPVLWNIGVDVAMAMMPNMINLAVYNQHLLIADPVFRTLEEHGGVEEDLNANWQLDPGEDLNGDGLLTTFRDPMISYVTERLPAELVPHFFDIWSSYHMKGGQVHCATNILRIPRSDLFWWQLE